MHVVAPRRARAREAVPDRILVVILLRPLFGREVRDIVAPDKVSIVAELLVADPGPRALAAVKGVADAKVHADFVEWRRRFGLHLHAHDARDAKLPGCHDHDLVVQVPHDAGEGRRVDVRGRVVVLAHRPVHVEAQERGVAGGRQRLVHRLVDGTLHVLRGRHPCSARRCIDRRLVRWRHARVEGQGREERRGFALRWIAGIHVPAARIACATEAAIAGLLPTMVPAVHGIVLELGVAGA
mmetsp:Transcript_80635/g.214056  ORF Transcript_80635/g.214056 Transcript_80635/m.214056 type:complete len:240 (+) Transcript_80635:395-1114(+)